MLYVYVYAIKHTHIKGNVAGEFPAGMLALNNFLAIGKFDRERSRTASPLNAVEARTARFWRARRVAKLDALNALTDPFRELWAVCNTHTIHYDRRRSNSVVGHALAENTSGSTAIVVTHRLLAVPSTDTPCLSMASAFFPPRSGRESSTHSAMVCQSDPVMRVLLKKGLDWENFPVRRTMYRFRSLNRI